MDNVIPQAEIIINGEVNPELMKIYNNWFDTFALTEGKMSPTDCGKFVRAVTGAREDIAGDDHRVKGLFEKYNKSGTGLLDREEFVQFYIDCTLNPQKKKVVWDNLKQMNVRNDLKNYDDPYETHLVDKTSLPRYSLSQNEEFFSILFQLQNMDEDVSKEAFNLICTVTTNPKIYKEVLLSGETEGTDWSTILNSNNIFE